MRLSYKLPKVTQKANHTRLWTQKGWLQNHVCNQQLPSHTPAWGPLMTRGHHLDSWGEPLLAVVPTLVLLCCVHALRICHKVL